jgi:hypothetical protein
MAEGVGHLRTADHYQSLPKGDATMRRRAIRTTLALAGMLLFCGAAFAQSAPDAAQQKVLVKTTLLSFNDANVTGLYDVFLAKCAKPFRDQFTPDKLSAAFKEFRDQHIDIGGFIINLDPIYPGPAKVDDKGVLMVDGYFDTKPKNLVFALQFIRSEGEWKAISMNVKTR